MTYETMRQLADSWGLLLLVLTFLTVVGWAFRPGSRAGQEAARMIPLREDGSDGAGDVTQEGRGR
jgi:cytochrome c oxidase cbb3-type subunit 4